MSIVAISVIRTATLDWWRNTLRVAEAISFTPSEAVATSHSIDWNRWKFKR